MLIPVRDNQGWGFVNRQGEWVVEPKYDAVEVLVGGRARINYGGLWGYLDETGQVVVEPTFDLARRYSEGMAAVQIGGSWGYLDMSGEVVIPIKLQYARSFSDSMALVQVDSLLGFIDRKGDLVLDAVYTDAGDFREGAARVTEDGELWGLITKDKTLMGGRWFEDVHAPSQGRFAYQWGGRWGFMDTTGQVVVEPRYAYIQDYTEGRAVVGDARKQEFSLVDLEGNTVVPAGKYTFIRPYREGFAKVRRGGGWGFVDLDGNEAIPPRPGVAYRDFVEGKAAYRDTTGAWGFINTDNEVIIEPRFEHVLDFENGVCMVRIDNKRGYVDEKGRYVWKPSF